MLLECFYVCIERLFRFPRYATKVTDHSSEIITESHSCELLVFSCNYRYQVVILERNDSSRASREEAGGVDNVEAPIAYFNTDGIVYFSVVIDFLYF